MTRIASGRRAPARAAVLTATAAVAAAAAVTTVPPPAAARPAEAPPAAAPPADGTVEFSYSAPELSRAGDHVIWHWTLRNTADRPVEDVVLFHHLTPKLKVTSISSPCTVDAEAIRCDYRTLKAGQRKRGTLSAALPAHVTGLVQIQGRVTWRFAPASTPAPATAATADALPPELDESPQPRPTGSTTARRIALIAP